MARMSQPAPLLSLTAMSRSANCLVPCAATALPHDVSRPVGSALRGVPCLLFGLFDMQHSVARQSMSFNLRLAQIPNATRTSAVVINLQQRPSLQVLYPLKVQSICRAPTQFDDTYIRCLFHCCTSRPITLRCLPYEAVNDCCAPSSYPSWSGRMGCFAFISVDEADRR
jgi:hypothetical protein